MPEYDVAIIGGGPAGLVAARYCLHAHLHTIMFAPELGGKVNYPFAIRGTEPIDSVWGAQLIHQFESRLSTDDRLTHSTIEANRVSRLEDGTFAVAVEQGDPVHAQIVIVTTGSAPQRLFVAGEKEYWGKGLSFSAVSHAPLFRGRDVAVVGGGRRTLVAALELAQLAQHVYLIAAHKYMMAELPEAELIRQQKNISVFSDWEVQEVIGDGEFVTHLQLVGTNGETRRLTVDGIFIQFSLLPNNELVRDLVKLDMDGHICVNHRCETNVPGLFAAGDVTNIHSEQVLVAIGEGAKAALSAWEYFATRC